MNKRLDFTLIVLLAFQMIIGCKNSLDQRLAEAKRTLSMQVKRQAELREELAAQYRDLTPSVAEKNLRQELMALQSEFNSIRGSIERMRTSIRQIQEVSATISNLEDARRRMDTQYSDILSQHSLFREQEGGFGYIGTQLQRRVTLQTLRDINTNIINQCKLQLEWFDEFREMAQNRIMAVSFSDPDIRRRVYIKRDRELQQADDKAVNIRQLLTFHQDYDFSNLERLMGN